jgi:hypothetical protein
MEVVVECLSRRRKDTEIRELMRSYEYGVNINRRSTIPL